MSCALTPLCPAVSLQLVTDQLSYHLSVAAKTSEADMGCAWHMCCDCTPRQIQGTAAARKLQKQPSTDGNRK